jgi:hypothetical protein
MPNTTFECILHKYISVNHKELREKDVIKNNIAPKDEERMYP